MATARLAQDTDATDIARLANLMRANAWWPAWIPEWTADYALAYLHANHASHVIEDGGPILLFGGCPALEDMVLDQSGVLDISHAIIAWDPTLQTLVLQAARRLLLRTVLLYLQGQGVHRVFRREPVVLPCKPVEMDVQGFRTSVTQVGTDSDPTNPRSTGNTQLTWWDLDIGALVLPS